MIFYMFLCKRLPEGKPPFSYGFPMVFPLNPTFSYGFPMVSHGFPMVFLWFRGGYTFSPWSHLAVPWQQPLVLGEACRVEAGIAHLASLGELRGNFRRRHVKAGIINHHWYNISSFDN
jgi:hypothetical protein